MDKKFIMMLLATVMLLPAMGQEVEVTSQRRLLEGVEGPAYYPVLNEAGNRLLFVTEDGALKYHDFIDGVTTVVTRDYVAVTARSITSPRKWEKTAWFTARDNALTP